MPADVVKIEDAPSRRKAGKRASKAASPMPGHKMNPPPAPATTAGAHDKAGQDRTRSLTFRVTPELRRAIKQAATARGCKKSDLLERMFTDWSASARP